MTDLEGIASYFDWWLQHQERERAREGLQTDDDTMIVKPPKWPDRRQLKAIAGAALDGHKRIAEMEAALERIAALNDLSGFEDQCSAAYGCLAECEAIARAALERK